MAANRSGSALPSVADFRAALCSARLGEAERAWLVAHARLPKSAGSMRRIAGAAGYDQWRAANSQYGRVAGKIGEALDSRRFGWLGSGQNMPWIAQIVENDAQGESVWQLRPSLVAALEQEGWLSVPSRPSVRAGSAVWRLITHHEDPDGATRTMLAEGLVAIGWTDIGDLEKRNPLGPREIASWIREQYPDLENSGPGGSSLWRFWTDVRPGDLVILSNGQVRTHVVEITGEYFYSRQTHAVLGYGHLRQATLTGIDADELWTASGAAVAKGENVRWTFARCNTGRAGPVVFEEGSRYDLVTTAYERNPKARAACIAHHGLRCFVCGFDFSAVYGRLGDNFIHVHHRIPLADRRGVYHVDPVRDLIPLCPNCHAMVHLQQPAMDIEELRAIVQLHSRG